MKLLFDENLSVKLAARVAALFPGSDHVRNCGLTGATDEVIWRYAQAHEFAIVSKDTDFYYRGLLDGHPPKVLWLRVGNCTTEQAAELIVEWELQIHRLGADQNESVLVLSR